MNEERPAGTPVLRRMNRAAVLDAVRQCAPEPVRLAELARLTELTRPTVTQAVEDLLAADWLRQHAPEPATVGRPATRFSLNGRAAPVLALDVGPHTVTAGVADLAGEHLAVIRRAVRRRDAQHLLDAVDETAGEALAAAGLAAERISAVTAGTPGIVEATTGRVLFAPSMPGWSEIDLVGHLRARFRCPVTVENDANLAALAAAHQRTGPVTLLAVQWGERLGAGVVIDGRLHRGAGQAGEIGFIRAAGGLPDATGDGRGPLERAIGAEAIVELARRSAAAQPGSRLAGVTSPAAVFAAAGDDPIAAEVVDQVAATFAEAIAPVVLVLSPHAIVIGGGIARAGSVLLDAIARHLEDLTLTPPSVELSALAENTVLTGAIQLALDEVWRDTLAAC
ncbi:ROK family transcriptional regulator [Nonomuraea guangzhouensis]|uniref:ROK family protein n=1 Tax=Nonomuraea guangzhouensis TaxID=1291555 RepID=A0ABW4GT47_9ACTN|nr:ROK family transcriptional regulator [Nonomuraea guangzhouensis]